MKEEEIRKEIHRLQLEVAEEEQLKKEREELLNRQIHLCKDLER